MTHGELINKRNRVSALLVSMNERKANPELDNQIKTLKQELIALDNEFWAGEEILRANRMPASEIVKDDVKFFIPILICWDKSWNSITGPKSIVWKTLPKF